MINGIFTIIGAIVGGIISYLTARDKKELTALHRKIEEQQEKIDSMKKYVVQLGAQVSAYWNVEKAYSEEIATMTNINAKTILQKHRDSIEAKGFVRPTLTEKGVSDILEKL